MYNYKLHYVPRRLSREEEVDLSLRIALGEEFAYFELIRHNIPLVFIIVRDLCVSDFDESVSVGISGLCRAASSFRGDKGARFSTYASRWIRQYISKYFSEDRIDVRIPQSSYRKMCKVRTAIFNLQSQDVNFPSIDEIFSELQRMGHCKISRNAILSYLPYLKSPLSLDCLIGEDGNTFHDTIVDENFILPGDRIVLSEDCALVMSLMKELKDRDRMILDERFFKGKTLGEVASLVDLTRERVRQIQNLALEKLRKLFIANS